MRVQLVAKVVLDAERLPSGDDASPVHERPADEPESDDRRDLEHEHPRVRVAVNLVDDDARRTGTRTPASWERIASADETISEARYGRRKPRRRTKVRHPLSAVLRGRRRARLRRVRIDDAQPLNQAGPRRGVGLSVSSRLGSVCPETETGGRNDSTRAELRGKADIDFPHLTLLESPNGRQRLTSGAGRPPAADTSFPGHRDASCAFPQRPRG